ncbi:hypothetical protein C9374_010080 [Naegleria lovaniensis]|uniref:Uncharacterized protein n=1 Tax=Naegleria lovaniensis TaxID=51637 RepID=A0AA88GJ27_NAELO|nr:uncharacterized protein C9374_010080 [Naegleria lovaniensis]KAG2375076.1 hypothetical protein C9374_010080 [Naegleria lovaniensis]
MNGHKQAAHTPVILCFCEMTTLPCSSSFNLFQKLKEHVQIQKKYKHVCTRTQSISKKFQKWNKTIENDSMTRPFDVKISYHHECILVSELRTNSIQIFDLDSREYLNCVQIDNTFTQHSTPIGLCIEENYDGYYNDALILGFSNTITKYDLKHIFNHMEDDDSIRLSEQRACWTWQISNDDRINNMLRMNVHPFRKQLFICEFALRVVTILDSKTGMKIGCIQDRTYCIPVSMDFTRDGRLVVGLSNAIQIFAERDGQYSSQTVIGTNGKLGTCVGLAHDPSSRNIFTCTKLGFIQVVSLDGKILRKFQSCTTSTSSIYKNHCKSNEFIWDSRTMQSGMCLNKLTGELFVCDWTQSSVQIYK